MLKQVVKLILNLNNYFRSKALQAQNVNFKACRKGHMVSKHTKTSAVVIRAAGICTINVVFAITTRSNTDDSGPQNVHCKLTSGLHQPEETKAVSNGRCHTGYQGSTVGDIRGDVIKWGHIRYSDKTGNGILHKRGGFIRVET